MNPSLRPSLLLCVTALLSMRSAACSREDPDSGEKQNALRTASTAPRITQASVKDPKACLECEKANAECAAFIDVCDKLEGNAKSGPKAGTPLETLCQDVMACVERTDCAKAHISGCYCGTAQGPDCLGPKADGACKVELEAALESVDPIVVARRFDETGFAGSIALWRYGCRHRHCEKLCF